MFEKELREGLKIAATAGLLILALALALALAVVVAAAGSGI